MTTTTTRMATLGLGRWVGVSALGFGSACVAPPYDAPTRNEDASAVPAEADAVAEAELADDAAARDDAMAPAPVEKEAPADFDAIQQALAANNAKLRALGVEVAVVEGDGTGQAKPKDEAVGSGATERKPSAPTGGAGGADSNMGPSSGDTKTKKAPGTRPSAPPEARQVAQVGRGQGVRGHRRPRGSRAQARQGQPGPDRGPRSRLGRRRSLPTDLRSVRDQLHPRRPDLRARPAAPRGGRLRGRLRAGCRRLRRGQGGL
jgi:hypothetical protein